jgi:hypothetical protein
MSSVVISGDTSGAITLSAPAVSGTNTQTLVAATGTLAPLISATAQNSTSGTSIDFTGIPSWVKRITVMFNGVSTNGTSGFGFQVGAGSITSSGYTGSAFNTAVAALNTTNLTSNIFNQASVNSAAAVNQGLLILSYMGSNLWIFSLTSGRSDSAQIALTTGSITLSGTLDRVRMTSANGTDAFDAGSINILYE